ncbi:MAG: peptidase M1, partial [Edaphobacter sp.]
MSALSRIVQTSAATLLPLCLLAVTAWAAPVRVQMQITGYVISADLDPSVNRLTATADVTFTALEDLTTPTFELNNGLQVTKATDAHGKPLEYERLTNNNTVRFTLAAPIPKGTTTTYHFEYSGTLKGADTSPVEGIKLASVEDPISILLYPGRWFPMTGLYTDRFTAEMHIRVPGDERVVGSGSGVAAQKSLPGNRTEFTFNWAKPGFPGTIIAGKFLEPITAGNMRVYVTAKHKEFAQDFASTGEREYLYLSGTFGPTDSTRMNLVELPDDAISATWAPEIAAIAGNRIAARNEQRLLSNTLAHQWWGNQVSPATMNDAWITNGMSRY